MYVEYAILDTISCKPLLLLGRFHEREPVKGSQIENAHAWPTIPYNRSQCKNGTHMRLLENDGINEDFDYSEFFAFSPITLYLRIRFFSNELSRATIADRVG